MKFEFYQDKEGNAYELKTDLEQLLVHDMSEQGEEIERLNNIINELEKYIKTDAKIELYKDVSGFRTFVDGQELLDKLQELKGSDKE